MMFRNQILVLFSILSTLIFAFSGERRPLEELYRTGKVRFVKELVLDETTMSKDVLFVGPSDLECDSAGNVYVMDFSDNNIKHFDPCGKFVKLMGRKGQGPGEFNMPIDIVIAKDRLIIWDMGNARLCALTMSGELIKAASASAFSGRPRRVGALPTGEIVLETQKIYPSEPNRSQDCSLEILTPDLQQKIKIYTHPVLRDKYMSSGGMAFSLPQPFCPDVYWDVSPSGHIVVGFSGKYEISIYDKDGAKLSAFAHSYDPVKVTAEEEKEFFAGMSYTTGTGVRRGAPDHVIKNTTFPKFKPAFNALLVDSDGNILVQTYRKKREEMYRYFDAFNPCGRFIRTVHVEGNVLFPGESRRSRVVDGCFWLISYSDDGLPHIIKHKISE